MEEFHKKTLKQNSSSPDPVDDFLSVRTSKPVTTSNSEKTPIIDKLSDFESSIDLKNSNDLKSSTDPENLVFELNENDHCQDINEQVESIFGDVRGLHIGEIFANQPIVLEQYQKIANGRECIYFEVPNQHTWFIQSIRTENGSLSGSVITAQALKEISVSDIKLLPSAWSYDLLTNEIRIKDTIAAVFGFEHAKLDFSSAQDTLPEVMRILKGSCRSLFLKEVEFFLREFQVEDKGGFLRWFSVRGHIANQDEKGHVTRLNGSIEDITERVKEIRSRQELEAKMLGVQKMEAIGELAGGIAHDFNNILTTVMGYTELAMMELMPNTDPKLSTYLHEIFQGGRRARDLVDKILTFSRTDQIQAENFALMQEVKDIVKMLRASLPSSIEISIDIDEGLPEVYIDKSYLQQMLMNVCINSRDAMPDGGTIYIRGRSRAVLDDYCDSCHSNFVGDFVELSIEDTGTGISNSVQSRIFEPYVSTKDEGSGLGLSMVHGIMHRQGGHLKVDSLYEDGTEFRFFLKPVENYGVSVPAEPYIDVTENTLNAQKHILVIDDEVSLAYFLKELLQKKGYEVSVASDSHEAWDLFSSHPEKYDLVVTDQTMPGLSGVQLAAKMLMISPQLPIILCTGYSDIVDEFNIKQYGIKDYMAKPIDSKELLKSVDSLLVDPLLKGKGNKV
ncbi:MAG: signal transduction histidine kinase/CheY-like chemotaxis protein [Candidatus Azotimanducaceae bacterium]|jgi:signal transduction histidine kinase/CheY-like chemotaxis protein